MQECQHCYECGRCKCDRGPRGLRGPRGFEGPPGEDGIQGTKGNDGPRGSRGPQGLEGEKGEQGIQGIKGVKGDRGPQGEQGPKGEKGQKGSQGPRGHRGPRGDQGQRGKQGLSGIFESAYGDAYSEIESSESGVIKFLAEGPMRDVELVHDGLKVSKNGVYQVNYKVLLDSKAITCTPSTFHIEINDGNKIVASMTESTTSSTLTTTQLISLFKGDVVKLVAGLEEHFHYKLTTLQLIQIG